jgi:ElaB/YqjD/DUF883 family membrane-anchored ribosome-binding protein
MADKASEAAGRVAGAVEEGAKRAGDKASDIATKVADKAGKVRDSVEEMAPSLREARESVAEVGGNIYSAVDDSVKSQPMATLAVAAGIGFVLGALWKS